MSNYANLPAPSPEAGLSRYLQEIRKFPMLEPEEEYMLAKAWVDPQDRAPAHQVEFDFLYYKLKGNRKRILLLES